MLEGFLEVLIAELHVSFHASRDELRVGDFAAAVAIHLVEHLRDAFRRQL